MGILSIDSGTERRKGQVFKMMSTDIGIDLGTASILVYIKGKGVVLKEPSVVAFDRDTNKIKAIGEEARLMLGRTPGNIVAVRPLRQGVISDYTVTEKMIKYFIQKALGKKSFRKPRISVCVPSGVTEVEKKAVEDATYQAGAREVAIIEEPIAAAIGAGIDIARPCGNMIVDIGGGTADIAVISLGGSVVSTSIKIAGDDFDEAIVRYMRKKHNLLIGERTAEDIKIKIGTCFPLAQPETMDVRGRNLVTGLPKTVTVSSEETEEALREPTLQIVEAVHSVLEKTPPELAADVADRGIVLTGGGSLLRGLEELIEDKTGINTMTADMDSLNAQEGYRGTSYESVFLLSASEAGLRKVNEMYVPEQLQAGFSDMIDEYVHFNDSARNSIMEKMTPDYMVVGIGSKTESYKYKSEIISDETAFYTNEKKEISGICNQFLNGKTDQKLFCNEMKDRLNDYYGSRYELRNQPEAVEGRVNNMLDKLQHMFGV